MKKLFIECKYRKKIKLPAKLISEIPEEVALFSSVQFVGQIPDIKKQLEKTGKKVLIFRPKHCKYDGQILGCSIDKFDSKSFLYIGDGEFHPYALSIQNNAQVFIYNPINDKHSVAKNEISEKMRKKIKGALLKFMSSKNVGVLISTKSGQCNIREASRLPDYFKEKNFYPLIFDTLDFQSLEDFNFIDVFVNTACPRIMDDTDKLPKPMINLCDLQNILPVEKIK